MVCIKTVVGHGVSEFQNELEPEGYIWRFNEQSPGGHLFDDMIHKYATACWLVPEAIKSVQAVVRQGPLFFEPMAAFWEYDRDDLLGMMDVEYAPEMTIPGKYWGADEWWEIQGTEGLVWVTRLCAELYRLAPVVQFTKDGERIEHDVDGDYLSSFHRMSSAFVDRGDGHPGAAAVLRGVPGLERAPTGRSVHHRRQGVPAVVAPVQDGGEGVSVFNHVGQCVADVARSRRFYEELFGFTFLREIHPPDDLSGQLLRLDPPLGMSAAYLQRDGLVLELLHFDRPGNPPYRERPMNEPGLTHVSLSVDDIDATLARVSGFGGEVLTDTNSGGGVFIRDPDGQLVELLPMTYRDSLG